MIALQQRNVFVAHITFNKTSQKVHLDFILLESHIKHLLSTENHIVEIYTPSINQAKVHRRSWQAHFHQAHFQCLVGFSRPLKSLMALQMITPTILFPATVSPSATNRLTTPIYPQTVATLDSAVTSLSMSIVRHTQPVISGREGTWEFTSVDSLSFVATQPDISNMMSCVPDMISAARFSGSQTTYSEAPHTAIVTPCALMHDEAYIYLLHQHSFRLS
jgi:hypothetical protein